MRPTEKTGAGTTSYVTSGLTSPASRSFSERKGPDMYDTLLPLDPTRTTPWAQVGTTVTGARNARDALTRAGLADWNIRKLRQSAAEITEHGVTSIDNPEQVMLVADDPRTGRTRYLSAVGEGYGVKQNEDSADLIDTLVAESGAAGVAEAGQLKRGRHTFVTMKLPGTMRVGGFDHHELHLVVFNSHDGSSAFRVMLVPYRIKCGNQLPYAIRNHVSSVAIRHTSKSEINVAEIRSKLGLMYRYAEAFEAEATRMLNTEMTLREFEEIIHTVWPLDANPSSRTLGNHRRRHSQLVRLWASAPTQKSICGSQWAAAQAFAEYFDREAPASSQLVRATRVISSDDVRKKKQQVFDLLLAA
ncbi:DUF945 domain-containing protein [Saccharopolyspora indica]|uniref:DUF932 domain-containing protein n=1 Tax=Saccharopolyspora indica TaxID=1229659 RepID=UPI0022EBA04C|nr:DUF932 domain-containing protein [Saccharopolyspora indica]MDA3644369.1 DUF932 domain-containing protein [Saccharopolyspora indica]